MDFPTFCTLMNIIKIYQEANFNSQGFLNYFNLYSSGLTLHTYSLLQNFAKLIVKEDTIFKNLNFGMKINNIIWYDKNKNYQNNNMDYLNTYSKISLENLFILYRFFEMVHFNHVRFPYSINAKIFIDCLEYSKINSPKKEEEVLASFFKKSSDLLEKSYQDFQAVMQSTDASKKSRDDFNKFIFNILDLDNSTFLEIYELMILDKTANIYGILNEDMVLKKNNDTDTLQENIFVSKLKDYNINHVYQITESEMEYLYYVKNNNLKLFL